MTNAELSRRAFELWNERELEQLLALFHEDAVWDMTPFDMPDMHKYHGHEGMRRFWAEWLEAFAESTIDVEEVEERGDWTLSTVTQYVSGASSHAPVPFRYYGLGRWRDGKLALVRNYTDAEQARAELARVTATKP